MISTRAWNGQNGITLFTRSTIAKQIMHLYKFAIVNVRLNF